MANRKLEYVYEFIYAVERQGYTPTVQEIAAGCYLDEDMVLSLLEHLEQDRRISCNPNKLRGIRIMELDRSWRQGDQIYTFIRTYMTRHHFAPSLRDIAVGCGLGFATVYKHLSDLQADGRIDRQAGPGQNHYAAGFNGQLRGADTVIEKQADKPDDTISEQVFAYICAYNQQHGFPPSVRNIAESCYMARSSAHHQLYRLEAKGWITREPGRARGNHHPPKVLIFPQLQKRTNVQTNVQQKCEHPCYRDLQVRLMQFTPQKYKKSYYRVELHS